MQKKMNLKGNPKKQTIYLNSFRIEIKTKVGVEDVKTALLK